MIQGDSSPCDRRLGISCPTCLQVLYGSTLQVARRQKRCTSSSCQELAEVARRNLYDQAHVYVYARISSTKHESDEGPSKNVKSGTVCD